LSKASNRDMSSATRITKNGVNLNYDKSTIEISGFGSIDNDSDDKFIEENYSEYWGQVERNQRKYSFKKFRSDKQRGEYRQEKYIHD